MSKNPITISVEDQDAINQVAEVLAKISQRLDKFNEACVRQSVPAPFNSDIVALEAAVVLLLTIMSGECDCAKCQQNRNYPAPASHN